MVFVHIINISFNIIIYNLHLDNFQHSKENIIDRDSDLNPWKYYSPTKNSPYSFHLLEEDEIVLAEKWYDLIKHKF